MAATLANAGVNPLTGIRALGESEVESALSVMGSCGMYDYTGEWTFTVGLPAKSGVSGGILAVLPGHLGIGVYSPALDSHGNSVRGIAVCRELSRNFGLHIFRVPRANRSVIHRTYTADAVPSNRGRSLPEKEKLQAEGRRIHVYELQGDLSFGTVEIVVRDVLQNVASLDFVILDLARVTSLNAIAGELLASFASRIHEGKRRLLFTSCHPSVAPALTSYLPQRFQDDASLLFEFPDTDHALEWCENRLLLSQSDAAQGESHAALEGFELLRGLNAVEREALQWILRPLTFQTGDIIIHEGALGDSLFLLTNGEVSVRLRRRSGREKRLATFSAGMCFGEMALLEPSVRSATVYADSAVECWEIKNEDMERLWGQYPRIRSVFMENLALDLSRKLRRTNVLIGALSQ
jgi:glutaminase